MRKARSPGKRSKKVNYQKLPLPISLQPPSYREQITRSWHLRCVCTGAAPTSFIFTVSQLSAFMGIIATSATASSLICDQLLIKRVCVWGPVATAGTPVTTLLKWVDDPASNTQSGPPLTQTDTSVSFDRPAYCCLEPPKNNTSIFSQWADASLNTQWIVIGCPLGSVVDFWFDFIIDDLGAPSAGPVIAGGVLGTIYHKDMIAGGTTFQVPANILNRI